MNVKQFPLAVDQWQERDGHVIVCVEVGACAAIVKAVVLHGHQSGEVTPCVAQSDGALPAETLLPQKGQVHTWRVRREEGKRIQLKHFPRNTFGLD